MTPGDYFYFFFLGTIAVTRVLLAFPKRPKSIIGKIHVRHYMWGIVLAVITFFIKNLTLYAIGLGLVADELAPLLIKGPGYRDEQWRGCEDYFTAWSVAGAFLVALIVFLVRNYLAF